METMSAQYKAKTNKTGSRSVMTHRWHWRKWLPERHSQLCRVLATGRMNSALVEFEDGTKVVTSRYAVRKLTHNAGIHRAAEGRPVE